MIRRFLQYRLILGESVLKLIFLEMLARALEMFGSVLLAHASYGAPWTGSPGEPLVRSPMALGENRLTAAQTIYRKGHAPAKLYGGFVFFWPRDIAECCGDCYHTRRHDCHA